ncbi:MAG: glycosyltransferase [Oscillospiraceae bacterium]|nr:glycosyltransferase [Oscillospiraceae bacterium]
MVIGQYIDSFLPAIDGVIHVVRNYAQILNETGDTCYVVAPATPGYVDREPFEVIRFRSVRVTRTRRLYRAGVPSLDIRYRQQSKGLRPDIVHAHTPFGCGLDALRIAGEMNIPLVATFHSKYYDDFRQVTGSDSLARLGVRYVVWFLRRVDYVWTVNDVTVETLRAYGYRGPVEVMPNGVDAFKPPDAEMLIRRTRRDFRLDAGATFLFVGQLIRQKNVYLIVEALALLKQVYGDFRMVFVGEGNARAALETLCRELGLSERVTFTGNIYDREALRGLYLAADLFLFPSLYDTAALVVRESAAMETPSLLIEGSHSAQGVTDGDNGYLCQESATSLCEKILEILADRAALARVSRRALETLPESWKDIVGRVRERYTDIIECRRDRPKQASDRGAIGRL